MSWVKFGIGKHWHHWAPGSLMLYTECNRDIGSTGNITDRRKNDPKADGCSFCVRGMERKRRARRAQRGTKS